MKNKHFGFTLIELLVVIVIIGILATISTATFKSYFGKARDAARNTTVANITLMMKVDGADNWQNTKYIYDANPTTGLQKLFDDNDYKGPKGENDICYFIGMAQGGQSVGDDNQFVVATYGEETSSALVTDGGVIADGTSLAVDNVLAATLTKSNFSCNTPNFSAVNTAFITTGDTVTIQGVQPYLWINADGTILQQS